MTKKEIYVANDGKEFDNEKECLFYENNTSKVKEHISVIQNYCNEHGCEECAFYKKEHTDCMFRLFSPYEWDI